MIKLCLIGLCLLIVYLNQSNAVSNPKVVCYYESWGVYRNGRGKMTVNDIDSSLCTHLVYAYLGITTSYEVNVLDPYLMEESGDLSHFVSKKGNAKAMVSIGGSAQSANYNRMILTDADRTTFVNSVVSLLHKHNFDGVMIDWTGQYPTQADTNNYIKLLDKFDEKFVGTSYIIGITGPPLKFAIDNGFDVKKIINYLEFINVLTLDLHGTWEKKVDYSAPLDWQIEALSYWWSKGAPKEKLLMTLPMFARTWHLDDPANNNRAAAASSAGTAGPYTQVAGFLSYNELCEMMKSSPSEWTIRRDNNDTAVYAIHGREWVSFEDTKSCALKAKNVTTEGFGGIVAYALTNEDFHGDCGQGKFPLLHAINSALNRDPVKEATRPTEGPTVTHPTSHPVTSVPGMFKCKEAGTFRDIKICQAYHICTQSTVPGLWEEKIGQCSSANEGYDETAKKCINKEKIPGCN